MASNLPPFLMAAGQKVHLGGRRRVSWPRALHPRPPARLARSLGWDLYKSGRATVSMGDGRLKGTAPSPPPFLWQQKFLQLARLAVQERRHFFRTWNDNDFLMKEKISPVGDATSVFPVRNRARVSVQKMQITHGGKKVARPRS